MSILINAYMLLWTEWSERQEQVLIRSAHDSVQCARLNAFRATSVTQ